jgi:hypothetical protein
MMMKTRDRVRSFFPFNQTQSAFSQQIYLSSVDACCLLLLLMKLKVMREMI